MSLARRYAITAGAVAFALALAHITLPGVDAEAARGARLPWGQLSLGAVGLTPFATAVLLVEIAACLYTPWRLLRHGSPEGRARFLRWSRVLALALAALQGYAIARYLDSGQMAEVFVGGAIARWLLVGTITSATALLLLLAELIDRQRTVNGVVLLLAAGGLQGIAFDLRKTFGFGPGSVGGTPASWMRADAFGPNVLAALATTAATFVLLRGNAEQAVVLPDEGKPRQVPALALPASSTAPLDFLAFPATLAGFGVFGAAWFVAASAEAPFAWPELALVSIGGVIAIFALHRPCALGELYVRLERKGGKRARSAWNQASKRAVHASIAPTVVYLVVLAIASRAATFAVVALALVTAVALDILASVRAEATLGENVIVWHDLRGVALPLARAALAREGIACAIVGSHALALLQVLSPYASASVRVAAADEARARVLLTALLGPPNKDADEAKEPSENETTP